MLFAFCIIWCKSRRSAVSYTMPAGTNNRGQRYRDFSDSLCERAGVWMFLIKWPVSVLSVFFPPTDESDVWISIHNTRTSIMLIVFGCLMLVYLNFICLQRTWFSLSLPPPSFFLYLSQVSKKEDLRGRLVELLLQLSGPQQAHCIGDEEEDKMKRQV